MDYDDRTHLHRKQAVVSTVGRFSLPGAGAATHPFLSSLAPSQRGKIILHLPFASRISWHGNCPYSAPMDGPCFYCVRPPTSSRASLGSTKTFGMWTKTTGVRAQRPRLMRCLLTFWLRATPRSGWRFMPPPVVLSPAPAGSSLGRPVRDQLSMAPLSFRERRSPRMVRIRCSLELHVF